MSVFAGPFDQPAAFLTRKVQKVQIVRSPGLFDDRRRARCQSFLLVMMHTAPKSARICGEQSRAWTVRQASYVISRQADTVCCLLRSCARACHLQLQACTAWERQGAPREEAVVPTLEQHTPTRGGNPRRCGLYDGQRAQQASPWVARARSPAP